MDSTDGVSRAVIDISRDSVLYNNLERPTISKDMLFRYEQSSNNIIFIEPVCSSDMWIIVFGGSITFKSKTISVTKLISIDYDRLNFSGFALILVKISNKDKFFCVNFDKNIGIKNITELNNLIIVDQVPNLVKCIFSSSCIISGTNCLLTYLFQNRTTGEFNCSPITHDKRQDITYNFTEHSNNSTITCMEFNGEYLASGDDTGCVCLWNINATTGFKSVCDTLKLKNEHIVNIFFLKRGISIDDIELMVSTQNKLFLISYNIVSNNLSTTCCINKTSISSLAYYHVLQNNSFVQIIRATNTNYKTVNIKIFHHGKTHDDIKIVLDKNYQINLPVLTNCSFDIETLNPITLETPKLMEYLNESSDNVVIKVKDVYYSTKKTLLIDLIPKINETNLLTVGIPTQKLKQKNIDNIISSSSSVFEIKDYDVSPIDELNTFINSKKIATYKPKFDEVFENCFCFKFGTAKPLLAICCAFTLQTISTKLLSLCGFVNIEILNELDGLITINKNQIIFDLKLKKWLTDLSRIGKEYWIDITIGHNYISKLFLDFYSSKSMVSIEEECSEIGKYLKSNGFDHLCKSSRGLRNMCQNITNLDETLKMTFIPKQICYLTGLEQIYSRVQEMSGPIPEEIDELNNLKVLSLANNRLTGKIPKSLTTLTNIQRLSLHNNDFEGDVTFLEKLNCVVNVANNPKIEQKDVPYLEKVALVDFFNAFSGQNWEKNSGWNTERPVKEWYKVGTFNGHVQVIIMSSNNLDGNTMPQSIKDLYYLKMIELCNMPNLKIIINENICSLVNLMRLCIVKCECTGEIPEIIGNLVNLKELQLYENNFTGKIPNAIGNLTNLELLSLGEYTGGNNFTSGLIPDSFSGLINLNTLFIAKCNLIGNIPTWINQIVNLNHLDLQDNSMSGEIPDLSQLEKLSYLNIKMNLFSGQIPIIQLIKLKKLHKLSLCYNNFTNYLEAKNELSTITCIVYV
jgi:Leucine-rich repeat (LRR) protein